MQQRFVIIYNPRSGKRREKNIIKILKSGFADTNHEILTWQNNDDTQSILQKIVLGNFSHIIAAGGDGTVNWVGKIAIENNLVMGIIPLGSGNGLARSLGIKMDLELAVGQVKTGNIKAIDFGSLNGNYFFCTAGLGFDAHIGNLFSRSKKRGFWSYFKICAKEIFTYKSGTYYLKLNDSTLAKKAFLLTVCNSGQWGNDIFIAPNAIIDDNKLELVIIRPFPVYSIPKLIYLLFRKKIHTSEFVETISGNFFSISFDDQKSVHVDGEPLEIADTVNISIQSKRLNVIC